MYLIGGSNDLNSNNSFFFLDLKTFKWEVIKERAFQGNPENIPSSADEHSAVVLNDNMILFGGFFNGERINETYIFNFSNNEWRKVNTVGTERPCPRAGHASIIYSNQESDYMYVFGGKGEDNDKMNDLWRLDL
jgi:N-acetylneuraminic acid mutarotase